jgi:pre-mRNA-splicing helicase BRR2
MESLVKLRYRDWTKKLGVIDGLKIGILTGETAPDLKVLEKCNLILSAPEPWDMLSRRWKQRKNVQQVVLLIVDEIHLIGGDKGPTLEVLTSRMRYMSSQTDNKTRIVALSASVANAKDIGEWIGASSHSLYNFHPNVRPIPLEIHIQGFDIPHYASRLLAMSKPMYNAINMHSSGKPALIVVADRKQARVSALDIIAYAGVEDQPTKFLGIPPEDLAPYLTKIKDKTLKETLAYGVGLLHDALNEADRQLVETLVEVGAVLVLVAAKEVVWGLSVKAHLVVIMGTESFDGREHRYINYPITTVLHIMGQAGRAGVDAIGKAVILCHTPKKEYYKKFLNEPVPVESHLDHFLHDHISAEIVTKVVENKQEAVDYLTWTLYYRRLTLNPNYYNMTGTTHRHISDHLSELVENVITDLEQSKCVSVEDDGNDVSALNLGMIAAYYYIRYTTIELFNSSLNEKTKIKGILEILTSASEFDHLPMRHGEEKALRQLAAHVPLTNASLKYSDPHTKAFLLLQAHMSRMPVAGDLAMARTFRKVVS